MDAYYRNSFVILELALCIFYSEKNHQIRNSDLFLLIAPV